MKKSRLVTGFLAVALIVVAASWLPNHQGASAANVEEENSHIKIWVGDMSRLNSEEAEAYSSSQAMALNTLAMESPNIEDKALITFDSYLTPDEVLDAVGPNATIHTVYLWIPGETGRVILDIPDHDLKTGLQEYFDSMAETVETLEDGAEKTDLLKLIDSYGIFAVEISDTYNQLQALTQENQVDLLYNEYAERLSAESGKPTVYICVPEKPDGTL